MWVLTPLYTTTSSSILPLVPFPFLLLHHRLCSSICLFYGRSFASQEGLKGIPRDAQIRVTGDPLEAACLPRTLHADTTRAVDLPLDTHTHRSSQATSIFVHTVLLHRPCTFIPKSKRMLARVASYFPLRPLSVTLCTLIIYIYIIFKPITEHIVVMLSTTISSLQLSRQCARKRTWTEATTPLNKSVMRYILLTDYAIYVKSVMNVTCMAANKEVVIVFRNYSIPHFQCLQDWCKAA